MLKLALALALAASMAPALAFAQPYYGDERDQYCDQQGRCYDRANPRGYDDQDYGRYDDWNYGRSYRDQDYHYTGRVGSHWTDEEGRRCAWREVEWRDDDGYAATKWITVCR